MKKSTRKAIDTAKRKAGRVAGAAGDAAIANAPELGLLALLGIGGYLLYKAFSQGGLAASLGLSGANIGKDLSNAWGNSALGTLLGKLGNPYYLTPAQQSQVAAATAQQMAEQADLSAFFASIAPADTAYINQVSSAAMATGDSGSYTPLSGAQAVQASVSGADPIGGIGTWTGTNVWNQTKQQVSNAVVGPQPSSNQYSSLLPAGWVPDYGS